MRDVAETIGFDELHDHTARYAAMTMRGQRIALTDDGQVVAYLEPARDYIGSADGPGSTLDRLVAAGLATPAQTRGIRAALDELGPPPPATPDESSPFEELMRMRDEERS